MKKKFLAVAAVATAAITVCGIVSFTGCGKKTQKLSDSPLTGSYFANFTEGEMPEAMCASDGWTNGDVFNTVWSAKNVSFDGGALHLSISENPGGTEENNNAYFGGEMRSYQTFGYGDYIVKMKPAKKVGTASTFFTYSGPESEDDDTPWDEIDIEFLGKDTTKVQFNYFVNGVGGHEYMYNLGFDASAEYHEYGYRWTAEYIVWFVDGTPVYKVEASNKTPLPSTPGKILMNYWCGTQGAHGWMGQYSVGTETSDYQWIKTSATPIGVIPEKPDEIESSDIPATGWVDIDYSTFGGWTGYTIDKTNGLTISHNAAMDGWKCEGMQLSQSYSWVKFNIKNNDTGAASLRVDVKQKDPNDEGEGIGGVAGVYCEEEGVLSYDAALSAATIKLAGGQSADVVLQIKNIYVDQFVIFLNSMQESGGVATGSVTITGLKGIVNSDVQPPEKEDPENPDDPDNPDKPVSSGKLTVNGVDVTFSNSDNGGYDISQAENAVKVSYTDMSGKGYNSILTGDLTSILGNNNVLNLTIKNNGTATAKVRIDLVCPDKAVHTTTNGEKSPYANLSATYTGDKVDSGNDYEYGGADWVQISAGGTVVCKIVFKSGVGVDKVALFIDSSTWNDEGTHTGEIVLSNMSFTKEDSTPGGNTDPDTPSGIPTDGWANINYSGFGWNNGYTVDKTDGLKISHSVAVDGWKCEGMSISDYGWVKFTITNSGTLEAKARIDVKKEDPSAGGVEAVYCESDAAVLDSYESSAMITLAVGQSVDVVLKIKDSVTVNQFVVFLNSMQVSGGVSSGSITITNLQGIVKS